MALDKEITDSAEFKDAVKAAADEATKGLKEKNSELIAREKEAKAKASELEDKVGELADKMEEIENEKNAKSGDVDAQIKAAVAKKDKEIAKLNESLADRDNRLNRLVIDDGLKSELIKAKVAPQYMDAAVALIKTSEKITTADLDGITSAMINDKTLSEFVSDWATGDAGKPFVAADVNSGGGAPGANDGRSGLPSNVKRVDATADKTAFIRDHGIDAWKARVASQRPDGQNAA